MAYSFKSSRTFPAIPDQHKQQVGDHSDVNYEHRDPRPGHTANNFKYFDRDIHASGKDSEPLGPALFQPEANGFSHPHGGVHGRSQRHTPEFCVGYMFSQVEKDPRIFSNDTAATVIDTVSLHDALPLSNPRR